MIVQYYKVMGEEIVHEPGMFIELDGEVIGFVYAVYESTYDCVLFEPTDFASYENIICIADEVKWPTVISMLKEVLIKAMEKSPDLIEEWTAFFCAENIDGKFEEL